MPSAEAFEFLTGAPAPETRISIRYHRANASGFHSGPETGSAPCASKYRYVIQAFFADAAAGAIVAYDQPGCYEIPSSYWRSDVDFDPVRGDLYLRGDRRLPWRRGLRFYAQGDIPPIVIASPCCGHGFKFSPVIGEITTDLATRGMTGHDIAPFRLQRFAR